MFRYFLKSTTRFLASSLICGLCMSMCMCMSTSAWAYKVEKICEDIPATSSAPAQKKCKVVRVVESATPKGDGKGEAKKDDKKDAKPAAH